MKETAKTVGFLALAAVGALIAVPVALPAVNDLLEDAPAVNDLLDDEPQVATEGPLANTPADVENAEELLGTLPDTGGQPASEYDREVFGQRWKDIDRNGCGQRDDTLRTAATAVETKPGTDGCVVVEATIPDPYTGEEIAFVKDETGGGVDIDHVVPLAHAYDHGAWRWSPEQRETFANDAENLIATDAGVNREKSDQGPAEWLPPADQSHCGYAVAWIDVKAAYELSAGADERSVLTELLDECQEAA